MSDFEEFQFLSDTLLDMKTRRKSNRRHKTIKGGANNNYNATGKTPLYKAIEANDLAKVQELVTSNIDVNKGFHNSMQSPLIRACYFGNVDIVNTLLQAPGIQINLQDNSGITPLYIAAKKGYLQIVKALLGKEEIDVNRPVNITLQSPLHAATEFNHLDVVKELLKHPMINVNAQTSVSNTPLHIASRDGYALIANELLTHPAIDINKQAKYGATPLYIASKFEHPDVVNILLEREEIDVNKAVQGGITPLMAAIIGHNYDIIDELLYHPSIDVNKMTDDGKSTLYLACIHNDIESVHLILTHPEFTMDERTKKNLHSYSQKIQNLIEEYFGEYNFSDSLRYLFEDRLPVNAINAITFEPIQEGENMVNFHDEFEHGRFYTKSTYNSLHPKKNPYTKKNIRPDNVRYYKAR